MISLNQNPNVAVALALFDFEAAGPNQISFMAGDKLVISSSDVEIVESGQDWVYARHAATLGEGFVPSNFLQVASAEEESKNQIIADIKDLRYQIQSELSFKDGLRDVIRKTQDTLEKLQAEKTLKETEKTIDELEEQLDKLEMAFKTANFDGALLDPEDDDDDLHQEENWEFLFEPVTVIQPFKGQLKSIMKKEPSTVKKSVRFNCRKTLSEVQQDIEDEKKMGGERPSFEALLAAGEPGPKPPVAPPRRSSATGAMLSSPPVQPGRRGSQDSVQSSSGSSPRLEDLRKPKKKLTAVADLVDPTIKGSLQVYSSSGLKSWNKRYCVLKESVLYIYKKANDADTYDKVILPSYTVSPFQVGGKQWVFKAEHAGCKSFVFAAENKEDFTNWLNALSLATIVIVADLSSRQQQTAAIEKKKKKRYSIEGAKEGQALKAFRNSVQALEEE